MTALGKSPCDEAVIWHGKDLAPASASGQRWTLVAAVLGSSMAFIDGTVANVALPALQRDLQANAFQAQWVIESYALFLASLLLAGGALGDRFGRRRMFMLGTGLFTVASVACGLAGTIGLLIGARCLQGIGAALLVPGSLSLISAAYPEAERGKAIGTWSAFSGITAALGPVLGGYLVEHYSWTWAFLVNAPVGAVLLLICTWKVPESRASGADASVDVRGAASVTLGLAGLVYALIEAPSRGWTSWAVVGSATVGVVGMALFLWVEAKGREPMLPLGLFGNRNFTGANVLTLLLYGALGGGLYYLPLNLIQVQGVGATLAGAAMLPFIAIMFVLSRWAGRLVDRYGPRPPLVIGPVIAAVGFALFAVAGVGTNIWLTILPAVCVLGLGMSITVAPLTTTVMNAVGTDMAGVASGVNNAVSRTAALLALALFGLVMSWAFGAALAPRLAGLHLAPEVAEAVAAQRDRLADVVVPAAVDAATGDGIRQAVRSAFVSGFRYVMLICAALALLSAASAFVLVSGGPAERPRTG